MFFVVLSKEVLHSKLRNEEKHGKNNYISQISTVLVSM